MKRQLTAKTLTVALCCLLGVGLAQAKDQDRTQDRMQTHDGMQTQDRLQTQDRMQTQDQLRDQDCFPGCDKLTAQEREQYQKRLDGTKSEEERNRIRHEYEMKVQQRDSQN